MISAIESQLEIIADSLNEGKGPPFPWKPNKSYQMAEITPTKPEAADYSIKADSERFSRRKGVSNNKQSPEIIRTSKNTNRKVVVKLAWILKNIGHDDWVKLFR